MSNIINSIDIKDIGGNNLSNHIYNIINFENKNSNILKDFEKISYFIKENYLKTENNVSYNKIDNKINDNLIKIKDCIDIKNNKLKIFEYNIPDLFFLNRNLEYLSKKLSTDEIILLTNSIKKFINNKNDLIFIDFFGKILTKTKDYYVIYCKFKNNIKENNLRENSENRGEGINEYTFFVINSVLDEWVELPLITPEQIISIKLRNYILNGSLNSKIKNFNGEEKHYLKCLLVRILYSNKLILNNIYRTKEDAETEIEVNEELEFPDKETSLSHEAWVFYEKKILKQGRVSYYIPKEISEDDKEEYMAKLEETDPIPTRLKQISEIENFEKTWKIKYYGDEQKVASEDGESNTNYGVVGIINKNWQGALNIYDFNKKRVSFIYIGYGIKTNIEMIPKKIGLIQVEPKDLLDQNEPNFKEEPVPEENDEENKDEDEDNIEEDNNE